MNKNHFKGYAAERRARLWLHLHGYKILQYRYNTPVGEIDILARKGNLLVAAEVKARKSEEEARAAIQPDQWKRIARALAFYQSKHPESATCDIRFDAIFILPLKIIPIHIENAWTPPTNL